MPESKLSNDVESKIIHDESQIYDVIHSKPQTIIFIEDSKQVEAFNSSELCPIISFLRNGNYTVKEITEAYPAFTPNPEKNSKSDKSIYRYLNELKEVDLIEIVGQRVTKGKTATEKIWGRKAKMFYIDIENDKTMETGSFCLKECRICKTKGIHLSQFKGVALSTLLKKITGQKLNPEVNVSDWVNSIEAKLKEEIKAVIKKLDPEELDHLAKLPHNTIDRLLLISAFMSIYQRNPKDLNSFYGVF